MYTLYFLIDSFSFDEVMSILRNSKKRFFLYILWGLFYVPNTDNEVANNVLTIQSDGMETVVLDM